MLSPSPVLPLQISIVVSQPGMMGHVAGSDAKVPGVEHLLESVTHNHHDDKDQVLIYSWTSFPLIIPDSSLLLLIGSVSNDVTETSGKLIPGSDPEQI